MDISPRELRDTDIKEGFRGYHRDDVDELLERAAATIESLSERVRQVTERAAHVESSAQNTSTRNRETEETLQRTLILAQRTADEAVADAQQRARQLLEDAETKARTLVTEAEESARRMVDDERRRLESEVRDLGGRRDKLKADVDALEGFEEQYRDRLRSSLQADLDSLGQRAPDVGPRPSLQHVEIPPAPLPRREPAPEPVREPEPASEPEPDPDPRSPDPFTQLAAGVAAQDDEPADALSPLESSPGSEATPDEGLSAYVADEPIEAEVLDDDAFFASLREAVRDDAPLGPREEREDSTSEGFHDQEEGEESGRRRFRRRR
jgi:DivIVA domain-containing protein